MQKHMGLFQSLQKIDLSFNQIKKLPDSQCFSQLRSLKVLYLHDNLISNWEDLQHLKSAPAIMHLTLQRNLVTQIPGYRSQMVNQIRSLVALDDFIVTDEERIEYNSPVAVRFRALSNHMKILIPKFQENQSADQHLFNLEVDLYRVRRLYERNSPSTRIQAFYRGYKVRTNNYFSASDRIRAAVRVQKVFRGWLCRARARRELKKFLIENNQEELLLSQDHFRRFRANRLLSQAMRRFATNFRRERLLQRSALLIQTRWRAIKAKHQAYVHQLGLKEHPCLYFLKEQRIDLQKIFRILLQKFPKLKKKYTIDKLKGLIAQCYDFNIIRYPNPLIFKKQHIPIIQYVRPTVFSKIRLNTGTCKLIDNGKSITNTYLRFSGMQIEHEIIKNLSKRQVHTSNEDLCLIPNGRVQNTTKKRIEQPAKPDRHRKVAKNATDSYQELLYFKAEDPQLLELILETIWRYNMEDGNEVFMVFFPRLMNRVAAAMKIQQSFRAFKIRKMQKRQINPMQVIYPTNECWFAKSVIQHRAALCISQWWKYLKLSRRLEALSSIKKYISKITQPTLYIEESIYMNINFILQKQSKSLRFVEQNLKFDFRHPNEQEQSAINAGFIPNQENFAPMAGGGKDQAEQQKQASANDQHTWHLVYLNDVTETPRFRHYPIPTWIWKTIDDFNKFRLHENQISIYFNNFLGVFHRASFDQMCEVKDFNEIVDPKQKTMNLNLGLNFISIHCMTVTEAKKRALLVALLSYNLKRRSFVRMYTQESLGDGMCIKSIYDIWRQYSINDFDARMAALINNWAVITPGEREHLMTSVKLVRGLKEKQRVQEHGGYIVSEQGRWEQNDGGQVAWQKVETKRAVESQRIKKTSAVEVQSAYAYVQVKQPQYRYGITSQEMNLDDSQVGASWTTQYLQRLKDHSKLESTYSSVGANYLTGKSAYNAQPHPTTAPLGALKPNKAMLQAQDSKRNLAPGFYYHTSSKEPIAIIKNIGETQEITKELVKSSVFGSRGVHSKQVEFRVPTSGEATTKAGTAWPSTRQGAGSPNQDYSQPPGTAGSMVMYKSQNMTSITYSQRISPIRNQTAAVGHMRRISGALPQPQNMTLSQSFGVPQRPGFVSMSQRFSQSDIVLAGEEQNLWILRKQREDEVDFKHYQRELHQRDLEARKSDIAKSRHVSDVMKHVLKLEQEQNLKMYQQFNKEEKDLVRELRAKDNDRLQAENMLAKSTVMAHVETKHKRAEDKDFANNFSQIRNLITKQTKAGEMIKQRTNALKRNKANAQMIKQQQEDFIARKHQVMVENKDKTMSNVALLNNTNKQAINSTLFDPCEIQEVTLLQRQGIQTAIGSPRANKQQTGSSRKIIKLKKDGVRNSMGDSHQNPKQSNHEESRRLMSQEYSKDIQRVLDYVPNHNQAQFAEISAKMNHRKIPSQYLSNAFSQPRTLVTQSASGIPYSAIPGSRQLQKLSFIEESFPLNVAAQPPHPQTQGGMRLTRYQQL